MIEWPEPWLSLPNDGKLGSNFVKRARVAYVPITKTGVLTDTMQRQVTCADSTRSTGRNGFSHRQNGNRN